MEKENTKNIKIFKIYRTSGEEVISTGYIKLKECTTQNGTV
jgi:hypothetical protein